jgi:hypothetical protein
MRTPKDEGDHEGVRDLPNVHSLTGEFHSGRHSLLRTMLSHPYLIVDFIAGDGSLQIKMINFER